MPEVRRETLARLIVDVESRDARGSLIVPAGTVVETIGPERQIPPPPDSLVLAITPQETWVALMAGNCEAV